MYIAQIVIMTVILSYLSMTSSYLTTSALDIVKQQKQTQDMTAIAAGVVSFYDENSATLPATFADVSEYLSYVSNNGWKDFDGASFQLINDGGAPFSYQGGTSYLAAVVAPGQDGLDSTITAGTLVVNNNEDVYLIPQADFDRGFHGKSLTAINYCNNSVTLYAAANGGANPANLTDLTTNGFLNPIYALDGQGSLLKVSGGACYSIGYNKIDEATGGDDIS